MTKEEFRIDFIEEIVYESLELSKHTDEVFVETISEMIVNLYGYTSQLNEVFIPSYNGNKKFKSMKLDAAYLDVPANCLNLMIVDFDIKEEKTIANADLKSIVQKMTGFFENVMDGFFSNNSEEALEKVQLANEIKKGSEHIGKLNLFYATTNSLSQRVKDLNQDPIFINERKYDVVLRVIDINEIYDSRKNPIEKEDIDIDVFEFQKNAIPCIKAEIETDDYQSYLAIIPGQFLAEIYKKYSSRLLEDNVRSFLSVRGGVNKGIRGTILNAKHNFFTYNNGISATAKEVILEKVNDQLCINGFNGLQIINGGQTTASLASALIKDKADLSGIFVQMKLTVLKNYNEDFVRDISKYANSQNKVTNADLNSNHPFYKRIEDFSTGAQQIKAPIKLGETERTIWFFERARGQYDQMKMKLSTHQRKIFERINPKSQKIVKTDIAKYSNSANMLPYYVSWGAEVNSTKFFETINNDWNKYPEKFNESYFKDLVSKAIIFKAIEKVISESEWYKENRAYRAQLVPYTFSKFVLELKKIGLSPNYSMIWNLQSIPNEYLVEFKSCSYLAFKHINDSNRSILNIAEYCKREVCWTEFKKVEFIFCKESIDISLSENDVKAKEISDKKQTKFNDGIKGELDIFNMGFVKLSKILKKAQLQDSINKIDENYLLKAMEYCKFIKVKQLTSNDVKNIQRILNELRGFGIE